MADWIRCTTEINSSRSIIINRDQIAWMHRDENLTIVKSAGGGEYSSVVVSETPDEILRMPKIEYLTPAFRKAS